MNYELAKELKDAGFPQKTEKYIWYVTGNPENASAYCISTSKVGLPHGEFWAYPTLSELIEAVCKCTKDKDFHLEGMYGKFQAGICSDDEWYKGATPEEAVARLWMALKVI